MKRYIAIGIYIYKLSKLHDNLFTNIATFTNRKLKSPHWIRHIEQQNFIFMRTFGFPVYLYYQQHQHLSYLFMLWYSEIIAN